MLCLLTTNEEYKNVKSYIQRTLTTYSRRLVISIVYILSIYKKKDLFIIYNNLSR